MTNIPTVDLSIEDLITGKKAVLYTASDRGEFPHTFMKSFIPSSITLSNGWYVGYTPLIIDGFNMIEIPDIVVKGLQFYNIKNGSFKRYNQYQVMNPDNEKLEIVMTEDELESQLVAKKFLINLELTRVFDIKMKELLVKYGREADTWNIQLEEAKAYQQDSTAEVPFISNMASIRKIPLEKLVATILEKARNYSDQVSTLVGMKQKFADDVKAATTDSELNNIIEVIKNV